MKNFGILIAIFFIQTTQAAILDQARVLKRFNECINSETNLHVETSRIRINRSLDKIALDVIDDNFGGGEENDHYTVNAMLSYDKNYYFTKRSGIDVLIELVRASGDRIIQEVTYKMTISATPLYSLKNSKPVAVLDAIECGQWTQMVNYGVWQDPKFFYNYRE